MKTTQLHPLAFKPLRLGSIQAAGWLEGQLKLQAGSMSGKLDEFWPEIKDSRWFGGTTEGWERVPYWLDGLIPLAYTLRDPALIEKVTQRMEYILDHQEADGWLGPSVMVASGSQAEAASYDLWGQILATKMLWQYWDATGSERAHQALERAFARIDVHIDRAPLFNWGQFRWFEALIALYELYEISGDEHLLSLSVKLEAQGFDWGAYFQRWPDTGPTPQGRWNFASHVVNNAMAVKAHGLWWRLTGEPADRAAVYDIIAKLDRYHGAVTGVMTGDECLAGLDPIQGTELCAVVEYMYSLEVLLAVFGDPAFGDRLEKITFNALPATFSPDMWSHQYVQQVNQVAATYREHPVWKTNGAGANTFGVEPEYGCCTANLSQGWPKFAAHLWMQTPDGGLAACAYAPCRFTTEIQGASVQVSEDTEYPFRENLNFRVSVSQPVRFPLLLRIPGWAKGATLTLPDGTHVQPAAGTFYRVEREWSGTAELHLTLPMHAELIERHEGVHPAVTLQRGPLVYALRIGEDWRRIHADVPGRELPHADWEIYPTTAWNYALQVNAANPDDDLVIEELPLGDLPFSPQGAPVTLTVKGRRVPGWELVNGDAGPIPSGKDATGPLEDLTLIPYGCTNLRVAEFPVVEE